MTTTMNSLSMRRFFLLAMISAVYAKSCKKTYSKDVQVCEEGTSECTFFVTLRGESCDEYCERQGGTCLSAKANAGESCTSYGTNICNVGFFDNICTCSLGENPPPRPVRLPTRCNHRFGNDILICDEQSDHCIFYVDLGGVSCSDFCEQRGETCELALSNAEEKTCVNTGSISCSAALSQNICRCSLSNRPTPSPSARPTKNPTPTPTHLPTFSPTFSPTKSPTAEPTVSPTTSPTPFPTTRPTKKPTPNPTASPTPIPTYSSTNYPTEHPTKAPTTSPTARPTTHNPTASPTQKPTEFPTARPTARPTPRTTASPTPLPTTTPTVKPTSPPTTTPTSAPTSIELYLRICGKCFRNGCFEAVTPDNEQKCIKFNCALNTNCPGYQPVKALNDERTKPPNNDTSTIAPPIVSRRGTGTICFNDNECNSATCRNGACMASPECYPVKHQHRTPFDKNRINLVFVGSSFDTASHEEWWSQVNNTYDFMKRYNMFAEENEKLNVFLVDSNRLEPSFCHYNCYGIERLLCCNIITAQRLSSRCMPDGANLQTIVIHNDDRYGGAGYTYQNLATVSIHPRGPEILAHELGHSLFELADEYSYGPGTNRDPNCDDTGECSKWSDLIGNTPEGYKEVSCIPGCRNGNFFVGESSYMSVLEYSVGAVNDRYACCTYQALTKSMPSYCDAFEFETDYLLNFCKGKDYQNYGSSNYNVQPKQAITIGSAFKDKSKYMHVEDPLLVDVRLNHKKGRAVVRGEPVPGQPGLYRKGRVIGDFKKIAHVAAAGEDSVVVVKVYYRQGRERFYFSKNTTIEIPSVSDTDEPQLDDERPVVSEKAAVLNLVLDAKGRTLRKIQTKFVSM